MIMAKVEEATPYEETEEGKKWRAENDMRTLVDAEEIKKDKKRYNAALACAKEKMAAMKKVVK